MSTATPIRRHRKKKEKNTQKRKEEEKNAESKTNARGIIRVRRLRRHINAFPSVYNARRTYVRLCPNSSAAHVPLGRLFCACARHVFATRHTCTPSYPHKCARTRTCYFALIHWLALDARVCSHCRARGNETTHVCSAVRPTETATLSRSSKPEC